MENFQNNHPSPPLSTQSDTPQAVGLVDGQGRRISYLRLSITDRCTCGCLSPIAAIYAAVTAALKKVYLLFLTRKFSVLRNWNVLLPFLALWASTRCG
jgi:hypothetical protein